MKRRIRSEVERFFEWYDPDYPPTTLLKWIKPKRLRTIRYGRSLKEALFWKKIRELTHKNILALCDYCTLRHPVWKLGCGEKRYKAKIRCIFRRLMEYFYFHMNTFRLPEDIEVLRHSTLEKYTSKSLTEYLDGFEYKPRSYQTELCFMVSNSLALTHTIGSDQR